MANQHKAPKLLHNGIKPSEGIFYQYPQSMVDAIFRRFDGKSGNQIKLLLLLLGNLGNGTFRLSEKWVEQHTGMTKSNYHRTMNSLVEKGYVTRENGKVILNLPLLVEDDREEQEGYHHDEEGTPDDYNSARDDDYNIEINNEINKIIYNNERSVADQKRVIRELLGLVKIDCASNTYKAMANLVGEEPRAEVLAALINSHLATLKSAENMPQAYRYGILAKLLSAEYHSLKKRLADERLVEDANASDSADIAEILDDWFSDDDL